MPSVGGGKWRANCPHGFEATLRLFTVPPFAGVPHVAVVTRPATLEELPSPNARVRRTRPRRRVSRAVSPWTYQPALSWRPGRWRTEAMGKPGTAWDFHRSVKSAFVIRRRRQTPRVLRERTRNASPEGDPPGPPRCFLTWGRLARTRGRNATPPDLSRSSPFVTARCRATLAVASFGEANRDFWTRTVSPR